MFALGFWWGDSADCGWVIEDVTDDIGEAYEDLIFAREQAESGAEHWQGSRLMVFTQTDDGVTWTPLEEEQYAE